MSKSPSFFDNLFGSKRSSHSTNSLFGVGSNRSAIYTKKSKRKGYKRHEADQRKSRTLLGRILL